MNNSTITVSSGVLAFALRHVLNPTPTMPLFMKQEIVSNWDKLHYWEQRQIQQEIQTAINNMGDPLAMLTHEQSAAEAFWQPVLELEVKQEPRFQDKEPIKQLPHEQLPELK